MDLKFDENRRLNHIKYNLKHDKKNNIKLYKELNMELD